VIQNEINPTRQTFYRATGTQHSYHDWETMSEYRSFIYNVTFYGKKYLKEHLTDFEKYF